MGYELSNAMGREVYDKQNGLIQMNTEKFPNALPTNLIPYLSGLKYPFAVPVFINIIPPSQAYQQASCNIFNHPEVKRWKQHNNYKSSDKAACEQAWYEVEDQRYPSEQ